MSERCKHCGSRNHLAFDCSQKHLTYQPTAEELAAEAAAKPVPKPAPPPPEPQPVFEAGQRFRGCPPICTATNLPAHETYAAMNAFHERNGPSCKVNKSWQCKACGGWHMATDAPAPSGGTSGSSRDSKLPPGFVPFRRRLRESSFASVQSEELPQRQQEEASKPAGPVKKLEPAKRKPVQSNQSLGELFQQKQKA